MVPDNIKKRFHKFKQVSPQEGGNLLPTARLCTYVSSYNVQECHHGVQLKLSKEGTEGLDKEFHLAPT